MAFEGADLLLATIKKFLPPQRDADKTGRIYFCKEGEQGLRRSVSGKDIGAVPEDGTCHLQVPPEGMKQREVGEEHLIPDLRKGRGMGKPFGNNVVNGEGNTLRQTGASRGEHGGCDLVVRNHG